MQMLNVTPIDAHSARRASPRRAYTPAYKLSVVQETLKPGTSVAVVARSHGINANVVFGWRRLYREGKLGTPSTGATQNAEILPVSILEHDPVPHQQPATPVATCEVEIEVGKRLVRIRGLSVEHAERILRESLQ